MIRARARDLVARLRPATQDAPSGPLKMSVVVAVYNPGRYFETCAKSLLNQSMSASEYEVIFVDDGSTDGTGRRLDQLAAKHRNVTAIHLPNSGWPGRPRNVGLDAARGEYVYLVDHDDWLSREALERVYEMGRRNASDVVIGKIEGHGRGVPSTLFATTHERCGIMTAPIMQSMTPHKAFRRAFLDEHGIRFPEGRRRLEDHLFVVETYLRAENVSVLSDYTCYHHIRRDDGANAAFQTLDPEAYFGNLRECVDKAEALSEPGDVRDRVLRRWYTVEMLRRVGGKAFLDYPPDYRREMVRVIRQLALERFTSPGIWKPCAPHVLLRATLMRRGDADALERLAEFEASLSMVVETVRLGTVDGRLDLEVAVEVRAAGGSPALVVGEGGRLRLAGFEEEDVEGSAKRLVPRGVLVLRRRGSDEHRFVTCQSVVDSESPPRSTLERADAARLRVTGTIELDKVGGTPLTPGTWDLFLRLEDGLVGRKLTSRLAAPPSGVTNEPSETGGRAGSPALYATAVGNASLRVGKAGA